MAIHRFLSEMALTYKHNIGSVVSVTRDTFLSINTHGFIPLGILTPAPGRDLSLTIGHKLLVMGHGTVPGNSHSRVKAYAVMDWDGTIGWIFEGDICGV